MGNVPIGVVPSPSRRFRPTPFTPPRAGYGAPAATQQTPERRQIQAVAYVVRAVDASTVISWRAEAGGGRRRAFASLAGHAAAIAAAAMCAASSIGPEGTLTPMFVVPVPYAASVQPVSAA